MKIDNSRMKIVNYINERVANVGFKKEHDMEGNPVYVETVIFKTEIINTLIDLAEKECEILLIDVTSREPFVVSRVVNNLFIRQSALEMGRGFEVVANHLMNLAIQEQNNFQKMLENYRSRPEVKAPAYVPPVWYSPSPVNYPIDYTWGSGITISCDGGTISSSSDTLYGGSDICTSSVSLTGACPFNGTPVQAGSLNLDGEVMVGFTIGE